MAFCEETAATILFGGINRLDQPLGDTWLFDGRCWQQIPGRAPPARRYAAFGYHPVLKGCVLHGGAVDDHSQVQFGDAWLFRDKAWSELPQHKASVSDDHVVAFHRTANAMLMIGGLGALPGVLRMDNEAWLPLETVPSMPRHQCAPVAYDSTLGGLVLHGGETGHSGAQFGETRVLRADPALR
jgi:hypothetical protein